jgi:hypothetical protein
LCPIKERESPGGGQSADVLDHARAIKADTLLQLEEYFRLRRDMFVGQMTRDHLLESSSMSVIDWISMRGQGEDDVWSLNYDGQDSKWPTAWPTTHQTVDSPPNLDPRNNIEIYSLFLFELTYDLGVTLPEGEQLTLDTRLQRMTTTLELSSV